MLDAFSGRTVVVTGHTGFKGSWLSAWLLELGARVVGIGLDPPTEPSHFETIGLGHRVVDHRTDIRDGAAVEAVIARERPDFVFHLAAQALVPIARSHPRLTYETNLIGTLNVVEALRALSTPCAAVLVTSDKCYENLEWVWGYRETDRLGGDEPYGASKACAEIAIHAHLRSFFSEGGPVRIGIGRAGNVIGGGDWAPGRIVPDCVRAWCANRPVELRRPDATRPWQHVLEPLSGYLQLAAALDRGEPLHGEAFNFGPADTRDYSVEELVAGCAHFWAGARWSAVVTGTASLRESSLLKLNCDKAGRLLGWHAVLNFEETVRMSAGWYRAFTESPAQMRDVSSAQIALYQELAKERRLPWALAFSQPSA